MVGKGNSVALLYTLCVCLCVCIVCVCVCACVCMCVYICGVIVWWNSSEYRHGRNAHHGGGSLIRGSGELEQDTSITLVGTRLPVYTGPDTWHRCTYFSVDY